MPNKFDEIKNGMLLCAAGFECVNQVYQIVPAQQMSDWAEGMQHLDDCTSTAAGSSTK